MTYFTFSQALQAISFSYMQYINLNWRDGQPYSEIFDDIYYSSSESESISGGGEFNHVFFKNNGLPGRWQNTEDFVIAELGFGSGLNCMLTIREWLKHLAAKQSDQCLHYIAIEKFPLSPQAITEIVSRYPSLKKYCDEIVENYPPAIEATHCRHLFDGRVVIHYKFMDVYQALKNERLRVDAWYLDGFSPAKNSAMWSQALFEKIAQNSRQGTTCSTYTAAGFVRRNLQNAGFTVNKVSGYGKKREMLTAVYNHEPAASYKYSDAPWFMPPVKAEYASKKATIIGAGIAGLSVAYALVKRGWSVTVIDRQQGVAKETSANPAAISYPRLSLNNDVDSDFYITAFCYNLQVLQVLSSKYSQEFWFDTGLLQLMDKTRASEIINKFQFNADFLSLSGQQLSSETDGLPPIQDDQQVYINYKTAGVVLPVALCEVLQQECGDALNILQAEISSIKRTGKQWQCSSGSNLISESEIVIIANGIDINNLGLATKYPLEAIRGQAVELNVNTESQQMVFAVNTGFYLTPAINNKHYLGATYSRENKSLDVEVDDSRALLESANKIFPGMFKQGDISDAWVGYRSMSKDRVPIVGAVPDENLFLNEYADICHGRRKKDYRPASYLNGLYVSAAHGSRGFTSSFISAEIIASLIEGTPLPVSKKVLDYISPSRFAVNNLKRR